MPKPKKLKIIKIMSQGINPKKLKIIKIMFQGINPRN